MARKMNISKEKQIEGLRKAIANRKTPRVFLPSMKKRLAKLSGAAVFLLLVFLQSCAMRPAYAQTPVTIVPTQQSLVTNGTCTGSAQSFFINNRNQSQHYVSVSLGGSGNTNQFTMFIQGIDISNNVFQISDTLAMSGGGPQFAVLAGSGYYPTVKVVVFCVGANTFSLNYSGSTGTSNLIVGNYQSAQLNKALANGAASGTTIGYPIQAPYSNSSGYIVFQNNGAGPSGSVISVACLDAAGTLTNQNFAFSLVATTTIIQTFPVPASPCINLQVSYIAGGASASSYILQYMFQNPGQTNLTLSVPAHITGTTATAVKGNNGTLTALNLNTSASGTISIFDLATAACTGTPSTNTIAVLTVAATEIARSIPFNTYFQNGICIKASVAMDLTVGYQ